MAIWLTSALALALAVSTGSPAFAHSGAGQNLVAAPGTPTAAPRPETGQTPETAESTVTLSYITSAEDGHLVPAIGQVLLPHGAPPVGGWPVVSWSPGTVGIVEKCAASKTGQTRNLPPVERLLGAGYAVTITDYSGMTPGAVHHYHYLSRKAEGHSAIDLIRAGRTAGLPLSTRWVAGGHSQGGHAAISAASVAANYAPEFELKGVAVLAPATIIDRAVVALVNPQLPFNVLTRGMSTFLMYLFHGLNEAEPDLHALDYLSDAGRQWYEKARDTCIQPLIQEMKTVEASSLLSRPLLDPRMQAALSRYMGLPAAGWKRPIWIAQGLVDPTVPAPLTAAYAAELFANGAAVQLVPYPNADHRTITWEANPALLRTVAEQFSR